MGWSWFRGPSATVPAVTSVPATTSPTDTADGQLCIKHIGDTVTSCSPSGNSAETPHLRIFDFTTNYRPPTDKRYQDAYGNINRANIRDAVIQTSDLQTWRGISTSGGPNALTSDPVLGFSKTVPTVAILTDHSYQPLAFFYRPPTGSNSSERQKLVVGSSHPAGSSSVQQFITQHWGEDCDYLVVEGPGLWTEEKLIDSLRTYEIREREIKQRGKLSPKEVEEIGKDLEGRISVRDQNTFKTNNTQIDTLLTSGQAGIRRVYEPIEGEVALDWN